MESVVQQNHLQNRSSENGTVSETEMLGAIRNRLYICKRIWDTNA